MTLNILSIDEGEEYFAPVYWVKNEFEGRVSQLFQRSYNCYLSRVVDSIADYPVNRKVGDKVSFAKIGALHG